MKITIKELRQIIKEEIESCKKEFNHCMGLYSNEPGGNEGCYDDWEQCEDKGRTKPEEEQFQKKLADFEKWTVLRNKLGEPGIELIKKINQLWFEADRHEQRYGGWPLGWRGKEYVDDLRERARGVIAQIKAKVSELPSAQDKAMVKKALRKHGIRIK